MSTTIETIYSQNQQDNSGRNGAINDIVIGKVAKIDAKQYGRDEPHHGSQRRARQHPMPRLGAQHVLMVNQSRPRQCW